MSFHGPSDLIPDATVSEADARVAQTATDAYAGLLEEGALYVLGPAARGLLVGLLVQVVADVRAAGVLEGYRAGRREAAHEARQLVLEALEDLE